QPEITLPSSLSPPSSYGCDKCPRHLMGGGMRWTKPQYSIEFSADQLRSMGAKGIGEDSISEEWDVTEFVSSGDLAIS
ncbi:hypothetical protein, partial [Bradyrhizobium sp. AUGA SZCCT0431]|uniref:hypothetical protein n=1 Tax=Bradyrhizobium sp. AUGA SZCCT0431 TaxID=2807674 RepID=UPI001BAB8CFD